MDPQNAEMSGQSTRALEDEKASDNTNTGHSDVAQGEDTDPDGYPRGLVLVAIILALVMSNFLVALDLVRLITPSPSSISKSCLTFESRPS